LRVQVLEVDGVFHVHGLRACHDIGKTVVRHHQVVRLVHELSVVLLHSGTLHIRAHVRRSCRPFKRVLLLEAVANRLLLLRAALAVCGWRLDLHLEVGLLGAASIQVMVLHLMCTHVGRPTFQAAIALLADGGAVVAVIVAVVNDEDALVTVDLRL